MRVKRLKKYRKYINFFKVVYKFVPPFKIMVDGNFFHESIKNGFDLKDAFQSLFLDTPIIDIFLKTYYTCFLYLLTICYS
jgi:hypothetical protein